MRCKGGRDGQETFGEVQSGRLLAEEEIGERQILECNRTTDGVHSGRIGRGHELRELERFRATIQSARSLR